jgi:uncharacterized protein
LFKESDIVIVEEKTVKTNKPILLTGFQDLGMIGISAIAYIINRLNMEAVGYLRSGFIPTVKVIVGPEFKTANPFRIFKNRSGDLLALLNDIPIGMIGLSPIFNGMGRALAEWFHKKEVRLVVALGSYPAQSEKNLSLVAFSNDPEMLEELKKLDIKPLQQGVVGGLIVSIIDECIERKIPWVMLFAPTKKMGEADETGVKMLVDGLNKLIGLNIEPPTTKPTIETKKRSIKSLIRR